MARSFNPTRRETGPLDVVSPESYHEARSSPPGIAPPTVQYYPPWIARPDVYQDFYFRTPLGTAVPPGPNTQIQPPSVVFTTAGAQRGVITSVTIFVDSPDPTTDLQWILTFSGTPVPGWTRGVFPRLAQSISVSWDQQAVRIRENTVVGWTIVNNSAAGWTVGVEFDGWLYPSSEEMRILGHLT